VKKWILITLTLVLAGQPVFAAKARKNQIKNTPAKVAKKNKDAKLGTDFSFNNEMVNGRYQSADEALAVVEDEKDLNDLIGPRKHFKDRLKKSTTRR